MLKENENKIKTKTSKIIKAKNNNITNNIYFGKLLFCTNQNV